MNLLLYAPAKINLGLAVGSKLSSGFHKVYTVYNQVSLYDDIKLVSDPEGNIKLESNNNQIPLKENLAFIAASILKDTYKVTSGVIINIYKRIPLCSGLGGGSSDAAAVLRGLNNLWNLKISKPDLLKIASKIGSDVPYQLYGGTTFEIQGDKNLERFQQLKPLPKLYVIICFPQIAISARDAYRWIKPQKGAKNRLNNLLHGISEIDINMVVKSLHNDFEPLVFNKYPVISQVKQMLLESGAVGALLSGKGSSVYGLFLTNISAKVAYDNIKKRFTETYLATTI